MKLPHSVKRILLPFAVLLFVLLLYGTKLVYHQKFEANLLPHPNGQDSDEDRWVRAAEAVPSAPAQLMQWHLSQENIRERVSLPLCQQMPEPWRISVANEHWQLLRLEQYNVFLFSAHHDRRMEKSPYVRIITMMNRCFHKEFLEKNSQNPPISPELCHPPMIFDVCCGSAQSWNPALSTSWTSSKAEGWESPPTISRVPSLSHVPMTIRVEFLRQFP